MKFVRKEMLLKESISNKTIADIMNYYFTVIDIGADDQFIIKQKNGDKFEAVILGNGVSILPADKFSSRTLAGEIEEFLNRKIKEKMNNVSRSSERSFIGSSELNEDFSIEHKVPDWEEQSGMLRTARKIQSSTNNAVELRDIDYDKNSNHIIAIFYCPTTEQEVVLRPEGNNQYSIEEWNMISSLLGIIRQINDRFGE